MARQRVLLPVNVRPVHYDLTLTPDLTNFVFSGFETVHLEVKTKSDEITVNIKFMEVQKAALTLENGKTLDASINSNLEEERCVFKFSESFEAQTAKLYIEFTGTLNDVMAGFYRSSYTKADGTTSWMATTQFESSDARRAFPCWDEPSLKATFSVTMRVSKHLIALGNMQEISVVDIPNTDLKAVSFGKTPIMSTYLVAFIAGEFDYVEGHSKEGVRVRTYTPLGLAYQGQYANDVACKTLSFYSEYFDIAFPLPKIDQIAIPDFSAGAMENWGLVTYRTAILLYDPEKADAVVKQTIAYVLSHEFAHQWFGNLVTMEWWNDLWLNEGFATWVGWMATNHHFPDWNVWDQFVINDYKKAMRLDALENSHPIEVEILHAKQVDEIFDAISYSKGASVIRMLATYLGEVDFREGLRRYLKKFQYKNAVTQDLWEALGEASGKDVKTMMDSWTKQTGYPVVHFEETNGGLVCKQSRFFSSGKKEDSTTWIVPTRVFDLRLVPSNDIINSKEGTHTFPANGNEFFKGNFHQAGFFRTQYSDSMLPKLGAALAAKQISVADRIGIINDGFCLGAAGYASITQALTLAGYCKNEDDYSVWVELISNLNNICSVWYKEDENVILKLRTLQRDLLKTITEKVGWEVLESDSHLTRLLRPLVLTASGIAKNPEVIKVALEKYHTFMADGHHTGLNADLWIPVFVIALLNSTDHSVFDSLVALYKEIDVESLKTTILRVLGSAPTVELTIKALQFALSDDVRSQDVIMVVSACAANSKGRDATWAFFKDNWDVFHKKFATGNLMLARIITFCTETFSSEAMAKDVEEFFAAHPLATVNRTIKQTTENIRAQSAWLNRDREVVSQWLEANVSL